MVLEVYVIIGSLVFFLTENNIPKSMNTDRHLRNFLPKHALRCLYFALVHSHLTYGIHVWGNSMTIKKIITLQKRAIHTINKVWYRSHTEPLFKSNQILKFEDMYRPSTMQISLFVYDLNNDLLPKSFRNLLSQNCLVVQQIREKSCILW